MLNINNEIWKPVKGFEKLYEVSNLGRVRNTRGKIMKTFINNSGYECLKFTINKKRTSHLVHRLVADVFIVKPNVSYKLEVNHIDEDKQNNKAVNLEWVSSSENKQHSMKSGRYAKLYTMKNSLGKKHKSTVSKYHNVGWDKFRNKWTACVRVDGKNMFRKRFDNEIDAALHVNWIIDELGLTDRPKNIIV